jgi:class 3 adenylate cyclase
MEKTKLAAIMFTDIEGYSRMMEQDEQRTISILKAHNKILLPLIETFEGRVIDSIGDGLLIIFDSAYSASNCAINMQNAISAHNKENPAHEFYLRIGIHLGDIWIEEDRVYGNGVNIAARIQPLAQPGGICISEDMYSQLKNKTNIEVKKLSKQSLKNIRQDLVLYELITGHEKQTAVQKYDSSEIDEKLEKLKEGRDRLKAIKTNPESKGALEQRIESSIAGFVEGILDVAVNKWENQPESKKEKIISKIKDQDWYIEIDKSKDSKEIVHRHNKDKGAIIVSNKSSEGKELKPGKLNDALKKIMVGAVFTAAFGSGYFIFNNGWMIIPFILIGTLPVVTGLANLIAALYKNGRYKKHKIKRQEELVLETAKKHNGVLSVVQLADSSKISLNDSQHYLDSLTKQGWVIQTVDEHGAIRYEFPDLKK